MNKAEQEKVIIQFFKKIELFKGLSTPTIKSLIRNIEERPIRSHDFLYYKGEDSEHIYIIRYGELLLESFPNSGSIYIGPGDVISENSLLSGTPHSTSAYAVIDSLVYAIPGKVFMQLAAKDSVLSKNTMKLLSSRMKEHLEGKPLKRTQPRRLYCHLPLDPMDDFQERIESLVDETGIIETSGSTILKISQFKGMSHEKFAETLSGLRRKTPLIHLYFDEPESCMDLPAIVLQSDLIIFWE